MKEVILFACLAFILFVLLVQLILVVKQRAAKGRSVKVSDGIYMFTAVACPICSTLKKIFAQECEEGKITVVDINQDMQMASQCEVRSVPTTVVIRNGQIVELFPGIVGKLSLASWL